MRRIRQVRVISNACPFLRDIHRLMQIILSPVVNIVLSAPPTPWGRGHGGPGTRGGAARAWPRPRPANNRTHILGRNLAHAQLRT